MKWLDELKERLLLWKLSQGMTLYDVFGDGVEERQKNLGRLIEIAERAEWGGITVELGQNPSISVNNVCPICFVRVGEEHGRYKKSEFEADYMITPEGKLVPTGKLCPYSDEWEGGGVDD